MWRFSPHPPSATMKAKHVVDIVVTVMKPYWLNYAVWLTGWIGLCWIPGVKIRIKAPLILSIGKTEKLKYLQIYT